MLLCNNFLHLFDTFVTKPMKRSQTIKTADHKQKEAFYPLKVSCLCSKHEIKSSQTGWGDGSAAKSACQANHLVPRTRTLSRARAHCPAPSLPRCRASALLCHAHAHQLPGRAHGPRTRPRAPGLPPLPQDEQRALQPSPHFQEHACFRRSHSATVGHGRLGDPRGTEPAVTRAGTGWSTCGRGRRLAPRPRQRGCGAGSGGGRLAARAPPPGRRTHCRGARPSPNGALVGQVGPRAQSWPPREGCWIAMTMSISVPEISRKLRFGPRRSSSLDSLGRTRSIMEQRLYRWYFPQVQS